MKVKGFETTTRNVSIEVDPMDALESLKAVVYEKHSLPLDAYVTNKGEIAREVEYHGMPASVGSIATRTGSHSYFQTEILFKEPTKQQLHAISVFSNLYDLVQKAVLKSRS
jgi:hypothetical protein